MLPQFLAIVRDHQYFPQFNDAQFPGYYLGERRQLDVIIKKGVYKIESTP